MGREKHRSRCDVRRLRQAAERNRRDELRAFLRCVFAHEVREHYFWDLDPRGPALTAVLAYTPATSNLTRVELALPEEHQAQVVMCVGRVRA